MSGDIKCQGCDGKGPCETCGGYRVVLAKTKCPSCKHPRYERPGVFTAYEGKKYWSADGVEVTCHLKTPYTCNFCKKVHMTPAIVTELKRLEQEASPAPWEPCGCRFSIVTSYLNPQENLDICDTAIADGMPNEQATRNSRFIAEFRTAAPALLEAVETMHAALEKISHSRWTVSSQSTGAIQSGPSGEALDAQEALARVAALLGEGREK